MQQSRENGFCCGGGGGMSFIDEPPGKRVNQERARQVLETGADVVAVGCPFCMTMLEDGINATKGDRDVRVMDVAELLWQSVEQRAAPTGPTHESLTSTHLPSIHAERHVMDLGLTESELTFRDELRAWLKANLPPKTSSRQDGRLVHRVSRVLEDWQRKLYDGGYAGVTWPKEYGGRGASFIEQAIFQEEMALADAPERMGTIGQGLVGPTIIAVGTEEQKKRYLPGILSGEEIWCQGFSEPNAGSDVASLETKAVLDGDDFVVNGQKIWTSYAHIAELVPAARAHRSVGAQAQGHHLPAGRHEDCRASRVRPLKMMSGDSGFNEMFFSNVRVPVATVLGKVNEGWHAAITALATSGPTWAPGCTWSSSATSTPSSSRPARSSATASRRSTIRSPPAIGAGLRRLGSVSPEHHPLADDAQQDRAPGPEGSIQKLYWSELNQRNAQIAMEVLGPYALDF